MMLSWWIAVLNTLAALASTGFGIAALVTPEVIGPPGGRTVSSRLYPAMYAVRAIPLGVAVGVAVWWTPMSGVALLLLGAAMLAQIGDVIVGAVYRLPGMAGGAVFAALCHGAAVMASL